jgi:hypothetical protein
MRAFPLGHGKDTLVRNHELEPGDDSKVPHHKGIVYDPGAPGGTTTLVVEDGKLLSHVPSIAGTVRNCAGSGTPWGPHRVGRALRNEYAGQFSARRAPDQVLKTGDRWERSREPGLLSSGG